MASKKVKTKLTEATLKLTRKLQNIKDESEEAKLLIDSIVNHAEESVNHVCGIQNLSKPRLQILVEGVSQELEGCLNKLYQIKAIYYDIQTDCDDEDGHQIEKVENNFEEILLNNLLDKKEEKEDDGGTVREYSSQLSKEEQELVQNILKSLKYRNSIVEPLISASNSQHNIVKDIIDAQAKVSHGLSSRNLLSSRQNTEEIKDRDDDEDDLQDQNQDNQDDRIPTINLSENLNCEPNFNYEPNLNYETTNLVRTNEFDDIRTSGSNFRMADPNDYNPNDLKINNINDNINECINKIKSSINSIMNVSRRTSGVSTSTRTSRCQPTINAWSKWFNFKIKALSVPEFDFHLNNFLIARGLNNSLPNERFFSLIPPSQRPSICKSSAIHQLNHGISSSSSSSIDLSYKNHRKKRGLFLPKTQEKDQHKENESRKKSLTAQSSIGSNTSETSESYVTPMSQKSSEIYSSFEFESDLIDGIMINQICESSESTIHSHSPMIPPPTITIEQNQDFPMENRFPIEDPMENPFASQESFNNCVNCAKNQRKLFKSLMSSSCSSSSNCHHQTIDHQLDCDLLNIISSSSNQELKSLNCDPESPSSFYQDCHSRFGHLKGYESSNQSFASSIQSFESSSRLSTPTSPLPSTALTSSNFDYELNLILKSVVPPPIIPDENEYLLIVITDIVSISEFYFHIINSSCGQSSGQGSSQIPNQISGQITTGQLRGQLIKFEEFQEQLQNHYLKLENLLNLSELNLLNHDFDLMKSILINSFWACKLDLDDDNEDAGYQWYRVKVLNVLNDTELIVQMIDFGFKEVVNLFDLYKLDQQFIEQPSFAVKSCLFGVHPIGGAEWTHDVISYFSHLVGYEDETVLTASIQEIQKEFNDTTYKVLLWNSWDSDPNSDAGIQKDFLINSNLVIEKYAQTDICEWIAEAEAHNQSANQEIDAIKRSIDERMFCGLEFTDLNQDLPHDGNDYHEQSDKLDLD